MKWIKNRFCNWENKPEIIKNFFDNTDLPIEYWEEKQLTAYQLEAIKTTLTHVDANNPYYHSLIAKSGLDITALTHPSQIQALPFTTKENLRENPYLILSVPKENISEVYLSTGTTGGESIFLMHTWEDMYIRDLAPEMSFLLPLTPQDLVINALPYEMSSAGNSFHRVILNSTLSGVVPVGKGGYYSDPFKTINAMKTLKASIMFTTPSYAVYLAEVAIKSGISITDDLHLKTIWITGEGCSNAFRARIEKLWDCQVYFYYGSLEAGPLGIECPKKDGYHLPSGHNYYEVVNPDTGKVLSPGEIGEIVITTLLREGSPLIRYKTQDLGYIDDIPCPCGIKLKKLNLRGRINDQININGESFSPFYIEENLMKNEEVGNNYRFIIYDDYLLIEIELNPLYAQTPGIEQKISSRIEYACGIPNKVKIIDHQPYTGGKIIRVINQQTKKGKIF